MSGSAGRLLLGLLLAALPFALAQAPSDPAAPEVTVLEFNERATDAEIDALLSRMGVGVIQHPDLLQRHRLVRVSSAELLELLEHDEVAHAYPASRDLAEGIPVRACAVDRPETVARSPSRAEALVAGNALLDYGSWFQAGPPESSLTWTLSTAPSRWPKNRATDAIRAALAQWAAPVRLNFRELPSGEKSSRNIAVGFYRRDHGDSYAFDGPGGLLAHTFYPPPLNPEPLAGDVHLDDDEPWSDGGNPDLYSVVLHELGHALGLPHSNWPGAVMYPYYRILERLTTDDIDALRELYPARNGEGGTLPLTLRVDQPPATTTAAMLDLSGAVEGGTAPIEITWSSSGGSGRAEGAPAWRARAVPLADPGLNTILLTARDAGGLQASQSISIVRLSTTAGMADNIPPTLTITNPALSTTGTSAAIMRISGSARDNAGVVEVVWECNGRTGLAEGTARWWFDLPLLSGDNRVVVRARDAAGNSGWRSLLITRR